MPTVAALAGQLIAGPPKPVICLDTCDILEVVQCIDWEKSGGNSPRPVTCIDAAKRLMDALVVNPDRVQLVITQMVHREWTQNIATIRAKAEEFLNTIDDIVRRAYQAAQLHGTGLPVYTPLSASTLVADLEGRSSALLNQATQLDLDNVLINRALQRVMNKHRPSHDGHIKDSINFEHYLEFARHLRAGGFTEHVLLVSKNRKDFWNGDTGRIHTFLEPQINDPAVQIRFFGNLNAALGFLHI
jgi:PIN domain